MTTQQISPPTSSAGLSPLTRAILWMGLALLSFSAIAVAGRESGRTLPTTELIFWRSLIGITILGAIYQWRPVGTGGIATTVMPQHLARALVHYAAQYAWLYALTLIPLAELFAIEFTSPLWVAMMAPLFLGERLTAWRMGAAGIGFIGAILVVEPGLFSGRLQMTASVGSLFAAASAVGFASSMIMTKRLTRTDPALRILFWMQVLQALIAATLLGGAAIKSGQWPLAAGAGTPLHVWAWVGLLGVAGLTAHFGLTRAFGFADAIIVAPMDFLRLPLIATVGAVFYAELLRPSVAVGATVVVAANALNMWAERRAKTATSAQRLQK